MWFGIVSLFPEMFTPVREYGVSGRAHAKGHVESEIWNPRDFTTDKHRTVDDRPYGGGPGMLMKVEPLQKAIGAAKSKAEEKFGKVPKTLYMSPQGKRFDQKAAKNLVDDKSPIIFVAGRYEGVDERLIEAEIDEEWSIGDFVMSGGEYAALVMMDVMIRLLPGVLGNTLSADQDSFSEGLLDCPHYTRPEILSGRVVPEVLLSGDHAHIARWRKKQSLGRTWLRRADLLEKKVLSQDEQRLLDEFIVEYNNQSGYCE